MNKKEIGERNLEILEELSKGTSVKQLAFKMKINTGIIYWVMSKWESQDFWDGEFGEMLELLRRK